MGSIVGDNTGGWKWARVGDNTGGWKWASVSRGAVFGPGSVVVRVLPSGPGSSPNVGATLVVALISPSDSLGAHQGRPYGLADNDKAVNVVR